MMKQRYSAAALSMVVVVMSCSAGAADRLPTTVEFNSPAIGAGAVAQSVGLETLGGVLTVLLRVGCKVPCETREVFSTAVDNQDKITIRLFRGSGPMTANATALGEYRVEGIPAMPRGKPQIEVRVAAEGRDLTIEATDVATQKPYRVVRVTPSR